MAHIPDIVVAAGGERYVIEYVNTQGSFLRCLRGMIALSTRMSARLFVVAIRNSVLGKELYGTRKDDPVGNIQIMSLKSLLDQFDYGRPEAWVG